MEELKEFIAEQFQKMEQRIIAGQKRVLNTDEAAAYLGVTKGHLYQMTSKGLIPFSKPVINGKTSKYVYFDRLKLDEWILSNGGEQQPSTADMMQKATNMLIR